MAGVTDFWVHFLTFAVAFFSSVLLTPAVISWAVHRGWLDHPDGLRKLHKHSVPYIGGIAIVVSFYLGVLVLALASGVAPGAGASIPPASVLLGGLLIAVAGIYDDRYGLSALPKFTAQILVAGAVVWGSYRFSAIGNPFQNTSIPLPIWLSFLATTVWLVLVINAMNLIDGMDGLAGGLAILALLGMGGAHLVRADLTGFVFVSAGVGAILGFLRYNWNPAKVFMGDTGSMFLGYLLGCYALSGPSRTGSLLTLLIPIVALGLPILDTSFAVFRRILSGHHPFRADHFHLHHQIVRKYKLKQKHAVVVLLAAGGLLSLSSIFLALTRGMPYGNYIAFGYLWLLMFAGVGLLVALGYFEPAVWRYNSSDQDRFALPNHNGRKETNREATDRPAEHTFSANDHEEATTRVA